MATQILVSNLARAVNEVDLFDLFVEYGGIEDVTLDKENAQALVIMGSESEAQSAVRLLNGAQLRKRPIKVEIVVGAVGDFTWQDYPDYEDEEDWDTSDMTLWDD